jgi:hypothetical protein
MGLVRVDSAAPPPSALSLSPANPPPLPLSLSSSLSSSLPLFLPPFLSPFRPPPLSFVCLCVCVSVCVLGYGAEKRLILCFGIRIGGATTRTEHKQRQKRKVSVPRMKPIGNTMRPRQGRAGAGGYSKSARRRSRREMCRVERAETGREEKGGSERGAMRIVDTQVMVCWGSSAGFRVCGVCGLWFGPFSMLLSCMFLVRGAEAKIDAADAGASQDAVARLALCFCLACFSCCPLG